MARKTSSAIMRSRCLGIALLTLLCVAQPPSQAAEPKLERVVMVSRHGVRAPSASATALEARTGRPWPPFPVEPGELTPHGAEALSRMGAYLRSVYAKAELLPETGCPAVNAVQVWADGAANRTRRSGQVLADAIVPGCGLVARHGPVGALDPVFDSGRVCPLDPAEALAAVQGRAAGGFAVTDKASEKAIAALKRVLGPAACKTVPAACLDGPSTLVATPTGPKIEGPLALAATVSENLLLEYAEGLPADQVAWGQGTPETLAALLPAHRRAADLLRRTPEIATFRAATLLRMLADLLQGEAPGASACRRSGRARASSCWPATTPPCRTCRAPSASAGRFPGSRTRPPPTPPSPSRSGAMRRPGGGRSGSGSSPRPSISCAPPGRSALRTLRSPCR